MSDTDITLYVPSSGELLTLAASQAPGEELADARERVIPQIREQLAGAERVIDSQLTERSDMALEGTILYGEPEDGVQFRVVVPSESAGADEWDTDKLEDALARLIADGHLTDEGAATVIAHSVTVEYTATTRAEAVALARELAADPRVTRAEPRRKFAKAGMNNLLKRSVAEEYVADARKTPQPVPRRVRIERIERRAA